MAKLKTRKCKYCGKEFQTASYQRQCCCSEHSHKYGALVAKERDKQFKRIHNVNDNFLDNLGALQCWYLGLMASDGYLSRLNRTIGISQSGDNGLDLINFLKEILEFNGHVYEQRTKGEVAYKLQFTSHKLKEKLEVYNIIPNKTKIYSIPEIILEDDEKLKYFLWGYIDGDGSVGVYKNMLTINFVCNPLMFEQLKHHKWFKNARYSDKGTVIDIRFNGIKAVKFSDIIYSKGEEIFKTYKYKKVQDYKEIMLDISPGMKYNFLRKEIFKTLDECEGTLKCADYAREHDLDTRYVWVVKEQWKKGKDWRKRNDKRNT